MSPELKLMKGSTCPICKSKMFVEQTATDLLFGCSKEDCDYNDKEKREEYYREKQTNIIVGDVLGKIKA